MRDKKEGFEFVWKDDIKDDGDDSLMDLEDGCCGGHCGCGGEGSCGGGSRGKTDDLEVGSVGDDKLDLDSERRVSGDDVLDLGSGRAGIDGLMKGDGSHAEGGNNLELGDRSSGRGGS
ncbi:MAG: hypothetical protein ABH864_00510 [archaeon]